jgi:hypothetical protein
MKSTGHLLLKFARRVTASKTLQLPSDASYDAVLGAWFFKGVLLGKNPGFELMSKKEDVETGEDRKGA